MRRVQVLSPLRVYSPMVRHVAHNDNDVGSIPTIPNIFTIGLNLNQIYIKTSIKQNIKIF